MITSWSSGMNSEATRSAGLRKYLRRSRSTTAQVGSRRIGIVATASGLVEQARVVAQLAGGVAKVAAGEVDEHVLERAAPEGQRRDGDASVGGHPHERLHRARAVAALDPAEAVGELDRLHAGQPGDERGPARRGRREGDLDRLVRGELGLE